MSINKTKKMTLIPVVSWGALAVLFCFYDKPPMEFVKDSAIFTYRFFDLPAGQVKAWFQPGAGSEVLSRTALEAKRMSEARHLDHFNLSEKIRLKPFDFQQSIAQTWPIKLRTDSSFQFYLAAEPLPKNCVKLESGEEIYLAECH